ncbi:Hypothetical predicted protein, partial [Paramuricea clavata]
DKDDIEVDVLNTLLFDESSPVENLVETCFPVSEQVQEKKLLKDTCRNITLVADYELEKLKETCIPNNTRINMNWAVRTWKEWAEKSKLQDGAVLAQGQLYTLVNTDIVELNDEELNYWMSKMVVEVRKNKDVGDFYPPNMLYQLCCGLLRWIRDSGRP